MNDCIEFRGGIAGSGYGYLYVAGRQWLAHRFAWFCHHGEIPKDMEVRHLCHNRRCVNPAHLAVGTHKQNMDDMVEAGRQSRLPGENNGRAILTESQVSEIRTEYAAGGISQEQLGKKYGVHRCAVGSIIRRKTWRHV